MTAEGNQPTSDERVLAALSHFLGLIVAFIVWATQKDKSTFVRFQALQAVAFDLIVVGLGLLGMGLLMLLALGGMAVAMFAFVSAAESGADPDGWIAFGVLPMLFPFVIWVPAVFVGLLTTAVRLVAAIGVLQGHDFRYPWLGRRVEEFLAR